MPSSITQCCRLEYTSFLCSHFLGSLYLLSAYSVSSQQVTSSLATLHPLPWPGTICSCPARVRDEARCPLSAHRILAAMGGPHCLWCCSILGDTALPALQVLGFALYPGMCSDSTTEPFLFTLNGICSIDPAKALQGFPCSSRSLRPAQSVLNSIFLMVSLCKISMGRASAPYVPVFFSFFFF